MLHDTVAGGPAAHMIRENTIKDLLRPKGHRLNVVGMCKSRALLVTIAAGCESWRERGREREREEASVMKE